MPPRQFGDEQRFIARQENSAFSLLILSLPPQGFRAPEGRARPCGTTNTNILPQRGFSTPAFPAACTQHIPLFPGSFPAPTPQLPHCRGARCALERSLPSLAFPGPGRQWSPQGSIPQKPPAPCDPAARRALSEHTNALFQSHAPKAISWHAKHSRAISGSAWRGAGAGMGGEKPFGVW